MDQVEVEKCTTGTNFSKPQALESFRTETFTQIGPLASRNTTQVVKKTRQKWTRGEYKQGTRAYYQALEQPSNKNNTNLTYEIWRKMNIDNRTNIDANNLASVRRDIVKNKRLTDTELEGIGTDIRKEHQSPKIAVDKNSEGIVEITGEAFTALYTPEKV